MYATVGLAAALFLVTVTYWVWPIIDEMLVDEADMSTGGRPEIPESWVSHHWEQSNETEAIYFTKYADCTFQISKDGTGTEAVSVLSLLECSQEDADTHGQEGPDGIVEFETVPSDFEAVWTNKTSCSMYTVYFEEGDGNSYALSQTYCKDKPRSQPPK